MFVMDNSKPWWKEEWFETWLKIARRQFS